MQGFQLYAIVTAVILLFPSYHYEVTTGKAGPGQLYPIIEKPLYTLGILIPDKQDNSASKAAEMAIDEINSTGVTGRDPLFKLVIRTTDGMWGTGSKESVHLVFEDRVIAYMGSLDGRNAHLAEQVATKTKVAFLSSRATEMSLSYAFVPWFFRCIPDDHQQAEVLLNEIFVREHHSSLALICSSDNDATLAAGTFIKTANSMNLPAPLLFTLPLSDKQITNPFPEIIASGADAILFIGPPELVQRLMPLYRNQQMNLPLFGTLSVLDDPKTKTLEWESFPNMTVISPHYLFSSSGRTFRNNFKERNGQSPGIAAAYAYDGIRILIKAIQIAGPDRDSVIETLTGTKLEGITGSISFDEQGNRKDKPGLMKIDHGTVSPVNETP